MTISANTNWNTNGLPSGGNLQFTNFTVNSGVTLTVPHGTSIRCSGAATINGNILVSPSSPTSSASGSYLGLGITQSPLVPSRHPDDFGPGIVFNPGLSVGQADLIKDATLLAGGTGHPGTTEGGTGGGSFALKAAGGITIGGTITADGNPGIASANAGAGGGGGGGIIVLAWGSGATLTNTGAVRARGGNGGNGFRYGGGGGGGGIIRLIGPGAATTGSMLVTGGAAGGASDPGTSGTNGGPGGTSGGHGGNNGFSNSGIYQAAGAGGVGHIRSTNIADPSSFLLRLITH